MFQIFAARWPAAEIKYNPNINTSYKYKHKPANGDTNHQMVDGDIKIPMYDRLEKCLILFFLFWEKYLILHSLGILGSGLDIFYQNDPSLRSGSF